MNKQELIKKYKRLEGVWDAPGAETARQIFLQDLDQLDESQKVTVPQFVADWIEVAETVYSLTGGMTYGGPGVNKWLENEDNQRTFVLAWFDGYEVEKEPKYTVRMKGIIGYTTHLNKNLDSQNWFFASKNEVDGYRVKHTRKELEDAGFGWVFDCEGVEIEEVTE